MPPQIPRTVKPRRPTRDFLPILAVHGDTVYSETADCYSSIETLPGLLLTEQTSLVAVQGAASLLYWLDERISADNWQYRVTPRVRTLNRVNGDAARYHSDTVVNFFGWKGNKRSPRGTRINRYHFPIDPAVLCNRGIEDIVTDDLPLIDRLYIWASDLRRFCVDNGLSVKPTSAGIAGQLLKDRRFYRAPRRKIPKVTNEKARTRLPGNYYEIRCKVGSEYSRVLYLDQTSSHHTCAADLTFPSSDHLRSYGHFHTLKDREWKGGWKALSGHGLFLVKLDGHMPLLEKFPPPWAKPGQLAWIYSNELEMLAPLGLQIRYVVASWSTIYRDHGLREYAKWATHEIDKRPREKPWLKPILLSTYGCLAATPKQFTTAYRQSVKGTTKEYPCGSGLLPVREVSTSRLIEPNTVNVIHRGMIEAECRKRSLQMARYLTEHDCEVIGVYADSVVVSADTPLPLLPQTWRVQAELTHFRYLDPVSFVSAELSKLPGRPTREVILGASRGTQYRPRPAKIPIAQ